VVPFDYNSQKKKPVKPEGTLRRESKIAERKKIVNSPPLTLCAAPNHPRSTTPDETN
jgi:hypothetical protein